MTGKTLSNIANDILNTIDYDKTESMTEDQILDIKDEAVKPFFEPAFRRLVLELKDKSKLYIDELTPATIINVGFSEKDVQELTTNFKAFIDANKDEIDALSIIYNKQYKERHLTYEKIEDFSSVANSKFELWKGRQIKRGVQFTDEQQQWLEEIKDYIVSNAYMELTDVQDYLGHKGGIIKAKQVFGQELQPILEDLPLALVG